MKVSVEKLPTSEAVLDVEVTWDEMQKASDKAYQKLVKQIDVQGFRRGRAPRSLVERKLGGKEAITTHRPPHNRASSTSKFACCKAL